MLHYALLESLIRITKFRAKVDILPELDWAVG